MSANLLLLHEFRVGTVVDNIGSEDGGCELPVDFFGVDILQFSIENELVALDTKVNSCLLAEKDEGENIAVLEEFVSLRVLSELEIWRIGRCIYLGTRSEEELVWIHAICNCTPNKRNPVKDDRWLLFVVENELLDHIEDDGHQNESGSIICDTRDLACY